MAEPLEKHPGGTPGPKDRHVSPGAISTRPGRSPVSNLGDTPSRQLPPAISVPCSTECHILACPMSVSRAPARGAQAETEQGKQAFRGAGAEPSGTQGKTEAPSPRVMTIRGCGWHAAGREGKWDLTGVRREVGGAAA